MGRGRRYNSEPKLNIKKVIAVIIAIIIMIMFGIAIKNLLNSDSSSFNLVSTTYFLINKDNKWGVMDNNSNIILEPIYDDSIVIPNNKKDIFICGYDVNYEDGTYKTKVLNAKNKELFKEYDKVNALENYDKDNNLWYEDNVLLVQKDGKYGLINFEGKKILDTTFDNVYTLKGARDALITVEEDKLGLVDCSGQKVIENGYEDIKPLGEDIKNYIVKKDEQYGINGILECKYKEIKALNNNNIFCVKENDEYKIINKNGEIVLNEKFDDISTIKDNIIVYRYNNEYCAYNIDTGKKLDKSYKELKYTEDNLFIAKIENGYGIINIDNEIKVEAKYISINYYNKVDVYELEEKDGDLNIILDKDLKEIAKGIINYTNSDKSYIKIWTEEGYKYYKTNGDEKKPQEILTQNNLFLSKKDNKYGFVDKNGKVIVDYIYDDAIEQNEFGYVCVKKDGLWGSLDKQGRVICQTKYNLDKNLLIDFIGEYHLGEDLNLMYYTNKD